MKQGVAVITSIDDSEKPSFGEVVDIFPTGTSTVWFGLRELQLIEFQAHFHTWAVKRTDSLSLKTSEELASMQVLPVRPARLMLIYC